jgi:chloramphenicol 3-O-phosphotransferase
MKDFIAQSVNLILAQGVVADDVFVPRRVLRDESALANGVAVSLQAFVFAKGVDVGKERPSRDADERVFDPAM